VGPPEGGTHPLTHPLPFGTAAPGRGWGLWGLGWASMVTASATPSCAFDFKIKVHPVLCVASVCLCSQCGCLDLEQRGRQVLVSGFWDFRGRAGRPS
jgi:hypothetical protein